MLALHWDWTDNMCMVNIGPGRNVWESEIQWLVPCGTRPQTRPWIGWATPISDSWFTSCASVLMEWGEFFIHQDNIWQTSGDYQLNLVRSSCVADVCAHSSMSPWMCPSPLTPTIYRTPRQGVPGVPTCWLHLMHPSWTNTRMRTWSEGNEINITRFPYQ